nr:hypothetical protein [Candidatus Sigynarchaeum springense]
MHDNENGGHQPDDEYRKTYPFARKAKVKMVGPDIANSAREKYHLADHVREKDLPELEARGLGDKAVTKDRVLSRLDVEAEIAKGKSPGHVYFQRCLHHTIPPRPKLGTAEARLVYVQVIDRVMTFLDQINSTMRLSNVMRTWFISLDDDIIQAIRQVLGERFFLLVTFNNTSMAPRGLREMINTCYVLDGGIDPGRDVVPAGFDYTPLRELIRGEEARPHGGTERNTELSDAFDAFKKAMFEKYADYTDSRFGTILTNVNPVEMLKEDFQFKGVQFGNYVPDSERFWHVISCYGAFHDIASLLKIEKRLVSLNGILGIAFGARGSGRNAAHYESGLSVINLTRKHGNGAVAHEWGHFLDNYLYKASNSYQVGLDGYASKFGLQGFRTTSAPAVVESFEYLEKIDSYNTFRAETVVMLKPQATKSSGVNQGSEAQTQGTTQADGANSLKGSKPKSRIST